MENKSKQNSYKSYISKKYNIPYHNLKDEHLKYYYTAYPELCCKYDLKPINNEIQPYEFTKAIAYLNNYFKDIKPNYYRDLFKEVEKGGDKIENYPTETADRIILEYLKFRKNTFCITVWPYAPTDLTELYEFLKQFGYIYYVKKVKLDYNAALNLIYQLYSDTKRFPTVDKLKEKLSYMGWKQGESNVVRAIFFDNTSNEVISGSQAKLKTKIREFALKLVKRTDIRGDDLIHINDNFYQTIEYAKIFLHKKSLQFLKRQMLERYMSLDFDSCRLFFNTIKKWITENVNLIDHDRFLFMGSLVLYSYGIRQCRDIDGLMVPSLDNPQLIQKVADFFYEKKTKFFFAGVALYGTKFWDSKWENKDISWLKLLKITNKEELVFNPEKHFYFNGMKLISLKGELARKYTRKKHHDFGDLIMISKLLNINFKLPKMNEDTNIEEFKKHIKDYLIEKYKLSNDKAYDLIKIARFR